MTDFSTWNRENLESFASHSLEEITHLKYDLRVLLDSYRKLVKETHDASHLQQLPTEQLQPDGALNHQPGWPHIQVDLF